jgi:hypothetical protein
MNRAKLIATKLHGLSPFWTMSLWLGFTGVQGAERSLTTALQKNHHLAMTEEKNNLGLSIEIDSIAESASQTFPAFLARPIDAPVYHGFQILEDVVVDGFTLGLITAFEEDGAAEGDAFVIAPGQ